MRPRLTSLTLGRIVLCGLLLLHAGLSLTMDGPLSGDDHYALWVAHSMWAGEALDKDVFDPGTPLQSLLSYAGQLATGHRPVSEAVMAGLLKIFGVVLAYFLARRVTGGRLSAAVIAAIVAVLTLPSGVYAEDRMVLYPGAVLLGFRYLDRPSTSSTIPLGVITGIAFLLRHDHGIFIGVPLLVMILLTRRTPWAFLLTVGALVLPWAVWVQSTEGLVTYFATRLSFSRTLGLDIHRPGFGFNLRQLITHDNELRLLWQSAVVATAGALVVAARNRHGRVLLLASVAALAEAGIMRELGRYPELATMWLPLGAWFVAQLPRPLVRPLFVITATLVAAAAVGATEAYREIPQVIRGGGGLPHRLVEGFRLQSIYPPIDLYAPPDSMDDRLFVRYVHECLDPEDRIWETSVWFSLPYQSERRVVEHPYWMMGFRHELDAQFASALPAKGFPPVIVTRYLPSPLDAFKAYPATRALVEREYEPFTSPRFEEYRKNVVDIQLLKHRRRDATGVFAPLDLPCFRRSSSVNADVP